MREPTAVHIAPVRVAKSTIRSGCSRAAMVRVSASTMRPSASVSVTSMVVPFSAVTTSFGVYAVGDRWFWAMASQASMRTGSFNRVAANRAPTATAEPFMSWCMSNIDVPVFKVWPPVSKQRPLPTNATARPRPRGRPS